MADEDPSDPRYRQLLWVALGALVLTLLCSGAFAAAVYWWLAQEMS